MVNMVVISVIFSIQQCLNYLSRMHRLSASVNGRWLFLNRFLCSESAAYNKNQRTKRRGSTPGPPSPLPPPGTSFLRQNTANFTPWKPTTGTLHHGSPPLVHYTVEAHHWYLLTFLSKNHPGFSKNQPEP